MDNAYKNAYKLGGRAPHTLQLQGVYVGGISGSSLPSHTMT